MWEGPDWSPSIRAHYPIRNVRLHLGCGIPEEEKVLPKVT